MKKVLVIAGPTASGKTAFSLRCAEKFHTGIISGDSIQVYRGFDIGSGKITEQEKAGIDHYLIDIRSPHESYSVSDFQHMARELIDTHDENMIICGGTGLYLKACLYDYAFDPEEGEASVDPELEKLDNETLYAVLRKSDPVQAEKIHLNNRRRLLRSLTIQKREGKPQSEIESEQTHHMVYDAYIAGCTMDREVLYNRINRRVEGMFRSGLKKEVEGLLKEGVSFEDSGMKGIGYREWRDFFDGSMNEQEVMAEVQKHSRQFAKRQYTWLNHQMPVHWFNALDEKDTDRILNEISEWYSHS
jgi:tRNA dimethylallyltransferase